MEEEDGVGKRNSSSGYVQNIILFVTVVTVVTVVNEQFTPSVSVSIQICSAEKCTIKDPRKIHLNNHMKRQSFLFSLSLSLYLSLSLSLSLSLTLSATRENLSKLILYELSRSL